MSASQPPLLAHATRDLARFSAGLRFEDIPAPVVERMKLSLLDSIGVCLHGVTLPWTRHVQAMVEAEGAAAQASIFGAGRKTSVANAQVRRRFAPGDSASMSRCSGADSRASGRSACRRWIWVEP